MLVTGAAICVRHAAYGRASGPDARSVEAPWGEYRTPIW